MKEKIFPLFLTFYIISFTSSVQLFEKVLLLVLVEMVMAKGKGKPPLPSFCLGHVFFFGHTLCNTIEHV